MRSWASGGSASSPSGQAISSGDTKRLDIFYTSSTTYLNNHSHSCTVKSNARYCPRIVNTSNSAACIPNVIQALTFSKMHKIQRQLKQLSIQAVLVERKKALRTLLIKYEMGLPWQSINNDTDNTAAVSRGRTLHTCYTWNRENNSQVAIPRIIFSSLLKSGFYKDHLPSVLKIYCFRKHSQQEMFSLAYSLREHKAIVCSTPSRREV